ncbi:MAG: hypothetical protein CHKLHMKO_00359 [Candidatus Argoarchaeum ethanivorans]|uniref:Uncharacterized protein n=1 Tax=Candidatus Argoarchaeum ethanivorans TaxID=2608793 RepID=A0A811TBM1_9EURY|nr:MAG: hypothetical protein CHKLHMKO_00359 [Candidatus Argoarchaeum ethanivorans]
MTEISKVFKGVSFADSIENYIGSKNVSICQFLFFLNIEDIPQYIEYNFYSDKDWHFRYDVEAMIKLVVVKFFEACSRTGRLFCRKKKPGCWVSKRKMG